MEIFEYLIYQLSNNLFWLLFYSVIVSLFVGSFLNVVILRLPIMMQRDWLEQCKELENDCKNEGSADYKDIEGRFDLISPRSRCRKCGIHVKVLHNIPIISYLVLKGKCASCGTKISLQYPLVEFITALLSVLVVIKFGFSWITAAGLLLTWVLITLSVIDLRKQILPDDLTLPLLWTGLIINTTGIFATPIEAILGATAGYMILWSLYWAYKIIRHKEGMGYGDFKLLAALGAWFGWKSLAAIILLSSVSGVCIAISMMIFAGHKRNQPIPFGPYLAIAGWLYFIYGPEVNFVINAWLSP